MKNIKRVLLLSMVLALLAGCASAEKASGGVSLTDASIGYGGLMTYSRPMPMQVTLENKGADVSGVLAVNVFVSPEEYDRYELPLSLASGARRQATLPVRVYYKQTAYTVEWLENGRTAASVNVSPTRIADPATLLMGVLTAEPSDLYYLNITRDSDSLHRGEFWQTVPLTSASLPEDDGLLSAFDFILVDRFDASSLSPAQLDALKKWVENGGILVLGGGADAGGVYPSFYEWTGITPGRVSEFGDITPALAAYLNLNEQPAGKPALVAETRGGGAALIIDGETPLLLRTMLGNGAIYTAAFSWSDPALTAWPLMHSFLQRLFLQDSPRLYEMRTYGQQWREDEYWYSDGFVRAAAVPNASSALPMLAILAAYLILGGIGGYFLLKKIDRREWMWGLFPALTALCVGAIALLARGGGYGEPMAVSFTHFNLDQGAAASYAAITVNDGAEHQLSAGDRDLRLMNTNSYYYGDSDENTSRPSRLRYRYQYGERKAVSLSFQAPWTVISARIGTDAPSLEIQADIHPTDTGMKGTVRNGSAYRLNGCVALTSFGFCSLPDLGPGESAEFALTQKADNKLMQFLDGVYVPDNTDRGYYSLLSAYIYPDQQGAAYQLAPAEAKRRQDAYPLLEAALSESLSQTSSDGQIFFRFIAFIEGCQPVSLYVDGEPVKRIAHQGTVSAALRYDPRGDGGKIYYAPGALKAIPALVDDSGVPMPGEENMAPASEYRLTDNPVFCFEIPDVGSFAITAAKINVPSYYYAEYAQPYVYDFTAGDWREYTLSDAWSGDMLRRCIQDGRLYVRFLPYPGTESYYSMAAPYLELEGKVN